MKALMIGAMQSGAGKTVMSCALMAALKRRGLRVLAFKSGPDYIDPMFHSRVLGVESRNLDLFLQGEAGVRRSFASCQGDVALAEGAMGYYDGLNGGTEASAWELAGILDLPTVLVLRPKGSGITLAAQVCGMRTFRPESRIAGLLLCDCSGRRAESLKMILERECGLPVLGYLPPMEEARLESRHLGLLTADEIEDFQTRFDRIAEQTENSVDLDRLLALAAETDPVFGNGQSGSEKFRQKAGVRSSDRKLTTPGPAAESQWRGMKRFASTMRTIWKLCGRRERNCCSSARCMILMCPRRKGSGSAEAIRSSMRGSFRRTRPDKEKLGNGCFADARQWRNAADFSTCRRAWRTRRELPGRCAAHSPDADTKPVGCSVSAI